MPEIHPEVKKSEKYLDEYRSAASSWLNQAKEDEDFTIGNQWTDKQKKEMQSRNQMPIVVNVIGPTVDQGVSLLTTNKPKFQSTGREDSDTRTGRVFSDIMSYIWDHSDANSELKTAIYDYYIKGIGYLCAYCDPNGDSGQGEICIKSISPYDVYVDPNSRHRLFKDASNIFISQKLTGERLKELYPQYANLIDEANEDDSDNQGSSARIGLEGQKDYENYNDSLHKKYRLIDRYTKIKVNRHHILDRTNNQEFTLTDSQYQDFLEAPVFYQTTKDGTTILATDLEVANTQSLISQFGEVVHYDQDPQTGQPILAPGPESASPYAIPGSTITYTLGSKRQILSDFYLHKVIGLTRIQRVLSVGGVLLYEGVMEIDEYPIVPICNHHIGNPFCISDVRKARGLQEYINKIRSLIVAHASSSTNVKLLIPRGGVDKDELERQWARAGTGVIEYYPEIGTPIVVGPVPLPNELYKNEIDAKKDIEFIFGIWQLMHGNADAAPATFKGTVAIDEYGQRRIRSKKDDVEASINQLARVVVQLIQKYYTRYKVFRIIQPNNKPAEVSINQPLYDEKSGDLLYKINDVSVGKYDIICVSGSTLPSNRWARFEYYVELYRLGIIDQVEVLKQTEVADIEGVLERHSMITQMQQQLQAASEEISKLEGDLQTAEREAVHAGKKVELEKFKSQLAQLKADMGAASQIYKTRLQDQLGMIEREMNVEYEKEVLKRNNPNTTTT